MKKLIHLSKVLFVTTLVCTAQKDLSCFQTSSWQKLIYPTQEDSLTYQLANRSSTYPFVQTPVRDKTLESLAGVAYVVAPLFQGK